VMASVLNGSRLGSVFLQKKQTKKANSNGAAQIKPKASQGFRFPPTH
jgi:hypothetical protein